VTEPWNYHYEKYFAEIEGAEKELPQFDEIITFSDTNVLEWYNVITAKELMEQNAGEIASYGAPPYARVVYSSSTLDGVPFSSDMIYGRQKAAQQYNETMRQIAAHTKQKQSQVEPDYYKDVIELTPEEQMMILESPYASPIDKAKVELRMAYDSILITKIPKAVEVVSSASGVLKSKLKQAISNFKGTEETTSYFRVQGGEMPNASQVRIRVDKNGKMVIPNKDANLNVSAGTREHAEYFLQKRGNGAEIVEVEVPKWFDDFVKENAIPQYKYNSNLLNQGGTAPKVVDPSTPGTSYEFPAPWIEWLDEYGKIKK
jgi:hypothetical protein